MKTPFDKDGAQYVWDSTSLKWGMACERLYAFQMLMSFEGRRSVHLVFGGHYAKALETYHRLLLTGLSEDEALIEVVHQTLINSWVHNRDSEGNRIPGTGHVEIFESEIKSRWALIRSIVWYIEHHKNSEWKTLIMSDGRPAVELSFKIPLTDDIIYSGHLDRVVTHEGQLYIQDQKTTSSTLSSYYFQQYDTDMQMTGYAYAGVAIFKTAIKGVMIDAAQLAANKTIFLRGFTPRTPSFLLEWKQLTVSYIHTLQEKTRQFREKNDLGIFTPNYTACGNYGGCPFRSVCSLDPRLRVPYIISNFQKREQWNPLEERN